MTRTTSGAPLTPERKAALRAAARQAADLATRQRTAALALADAIDQAHTIDGIRWLLDSSIRYEPGMLTWAQELLDRIVKD